MEIKVNNASETVTVIHLIGDFDKPVSKEELINSIKGLNGPFIIDLAKLDFAGSYFLGTLILLYKQGIPFKLTNVSPSIHEILSLTGITDIIPIITNHG
jgi:anti-anti-sigma factor